MYLYRHDFFAALLMSLLCVAGCGRGSVSVANADKQNTFELMQTAAAAYSAGQTEAAGYLFLAGQARFEIDKQVYPPSEKRGNNPAVLKSALNATLGQSVMVDLEADPKALLAVLKRMRDWAPSFPAGYDPGWEYDEAHPKAAQAAVAAVRKSLLAPIETKSKLGGDDEYQQLSAIVRSSRATERQFWIEAQNYGGAEKVPADVKEEFEAALDRKNAAATRLREIEFNTAPETRWQSRVVWDAEEYFDDPKVIELCKAIEADDRPAMVRLIEDGADVKAVGKDGMTLLLWAYPQRRLERFRLLLERGADPNVYFESNFGVAQEPFHPYPAGGSSAEDRGLHAGETVTHLAARSLLPTYLPMVLDHGGDPNILDKETLQAPLDLALNRMLPDVNLRVDALIAHGADLNREVDPKTWTS